MTPAAEQPADLTIGGLHLWIHGRERPASDDYYDGNWVFATAECRYPQSFAKATGSIVHLSEVARFLKECQALHRDLSGTAILRTMEGHLRAELTVDKLGHLTLVLAVTPDPVAEQHTFRSELDQSYLPAIIAGCQSILDRYPLKGHLEGEGVEHADAADKARS